MTTSIISAHDLFDYLLQREQTHDLALELVRVYDQRQFRGARRQAGR